MNVLDVFFLKKNWLNYAVKTFLNCDKTIKTLFLASGMKNIFHRKIETLSRKFNLTIFGIFRNFFMKKTYEGFVKLTASMAPLK